MTDIVERLREELADVRADAALLRAEIERLRAWSDRLQGDYEVMAALTKAKDAEIERLRAENQTAWNKADELDERARHAEAALRRALEPKP